MPMINYADSVHHTIHSIEFVRQKITLPYKIAASTRERFYVQFLLWELAEFTNRLHCNSEHGVLVNRLPVIITTIG